MELKYKCLVDIDHDATTLPFVPYHEIGRSNWGSNSLTWCPPLWVPVAINTHDAKANADYRLLTQVSSWSVTVLGYTANHEVCSPINRAIHTNLPQNVLEFLVIAARLCNFEEKMIVSINVALIMQVTYPIRIEFHWNFIYEESKDL